MILTTPLSGWFVIRGLGLAAVNLPTRIYETLIKLVAYFNKYFVSVQSM